MTEPVNGQETLSDYEKLVVNDRQLLLTKQIIIKKVVDKFSELASAYGDMIKEILPSIQAGSPKISKGENYLGLPYVMLDYPGIFGRHDIFAIRCFFWWGNFFSITLHLSGIYQQQYEAILQNAIKHNLFENWYISVNESQWEHHLQVDNYTPITQEFKPELSEKTFIKLAKKIPLEQWDQANEFFIENFEKLLKIISN